MLKHQLHNLLATKVRGLGERGDLRVQISLHMLVIPIEVTDVLIHFLSLNSAPRIFLS